jgi:hypothetical protein
MWEKDGEFSPEIGQEVDIEVFLDLRDCVPPAYYSNGVFQVGEAYDHDRETCKPIYTTLRKNEQGNWCYCGHCLLGQTEDKTKNGYGYFYREYGKLFK